MSDQNETFTGDIYCLKCKEKRAADNLAVLTHHDHGVLHAGVRLVRESFRSREVSCQTCGVTKEPEYNRVRSFRCSDEVWEAARKRAFEDGITASFVVSELLEGYALGRLDLPTTRTVKEWTPYRDA